MALFGGDTSQLQILIKARDDASKTLKAFDKRVQNTEANFRKMALRGGVAFAAIGAGVLQATQAAVNAQETFNKFNVVFGSVSVDAERVAQDLRDNFGLAESSAKALLSSTGDMLTGFGLSGAAALELAERTNKLAVDLASFTNIQGGAERASIALTKALLGERESVKELGIAILEEDVKAKVKAMEVAGMFTDETERQRKAMATLEIAFSQSKNAVGDYARTADSAANQQRVMKERLKELNEEFGEIFLPLLEEALSSLLPLINRLGDWIQANKELVRNLVIGAASLAGFIATVGVAGLVITSIIRTIYAARAAFIALRVAVIALSGPIGIVIAGVSALAAALGISYIAKGREATSVTGNLGSEIEALETELNDTIPALGGMTEGLDAASESAVETAKKVKELREEATRVIAEFSEDEKDYGKNVAEAIIDQEEKVRDLKKEIRNLEREEKDSEERDDRQRLQRQIEDMVSQLETEKEALRSVAHLEKQLTDEIEEAKRRAALTDFERTIEDLMKKRVARMQDHVADLQRLIEERDAAIAKDNAVRASFVEAQNAIQDKAKETSEVMMNEWKIQAENAWETANSINSAFGHKTSTRALPQLKLSSWEHGGIVNAPEGKAVPIMAHGQERIIPARQAQSRGDGGATYVVNINNPTIASLSDVGFFKKQVEDSLRGVIRDRKLQTV